MTGPRCPSCDTPTGVDTPLCDDCILEHYWIVRPVAHRETTRRAQAVEAAHFERLGYEIITALPERNDLWLCDACNAVIPITGDVHLIPALGTWAFCIPCAARLTGWPFAFNPPRACPCLGCGSVMEAAA